MLAKPRRRNTAAFYENMDAKSEKFDDAKLKGLIRKECQPVAVVQRIVLRLFVFYKKIAGLYRLSSTESIPIKAAAEMKEPQKVKQYF